MSYVADDKEVVTDGIIEKGEVVNVTADIDNINLNDGTRYRMELDKNEFIYLLLKIREDIDIAKISKKISEKVILIRMECFILLPQIYNPYPKWF